MVARHTNQFNIQNLYQQKKNIFNYFLSRRIVGTLSVRADVLAISLNGCKVHLVSEVDLFEKKAGLW